MSRQPARPFANRLLLRLPRAARLGFRCLLRLSVDSRVRRRGLDLVVGRTIEEVNRRDLDGLVVLTSEPDLRVRPVGFPVGTPELFEGHAGLRAFFEDWEQLMGWPRFDFEQVDYFGDGILIRASFVSRGRLSGVEPTNTRAAAVAFFSPRGRVREVQFHWTRETAAAAAGLRDAGDR